MNSESRSRFFSIGLGLVCVAGLLVVAVQNVLIRRDLAAMRMQVEEKTAQIAALEARCDRLVGGVTEILNKEHVAIDPNGWEAQYLEPTETLDRTTMVESGDGMTKSDTDLLKAIERAQKTFRDRSIPMWNPSTQEKPYEPQPFRNWPLKSGDATSNLPVTESLQELEPRIAELKRAIEQLRSDPQREEWKRKRLDDSLQRPKRETFRVIPLPFFPDGK